MMSTMREAELREHVHRMASDFEGIQFDTYLGQHGRFFTPAPLPGGIPQVVQVLDMWDCYRKSQFTAENDLSLDYAEGWAVAPNGLPHRHAWCVDAEGRVIDPEWPTPEALIYFGIIVPRDFGYAWRKTFTAGQAWAIEERGTRTMKP